MRYIDLDLLVGRSDAQPLIDAAEAVRHAIYTAVDAATRKALIKANRERWVAFRPVFQNVFGEKCWYTESRNPGTDDDVDHYRPKGRVAERPGHGGYWWEALHWRNFRLSCHRANRLRENPETGDTHGKGDRFPLLDEQQRWRRPGDVCRERPTLLDPTDPSDPPLLTFEIDGRVAVAPEHANDATAARRIEDSRIYLHLDWPAFVSDRRSLYTTVLLAVIDGDLADAALQRGEAGARDTLKAIARNLIRMVQDRAPYSRAANAYIHRFQDRDWVRRYVLPNVLHLPKPPQERPTAPIP